MVYSARNYRRFSIVRDLVSLNLSSLNELITMATITQREAACRQLTTAIRMYFSDGDMVAIHTLAGAARELFEKHCKKDGKDRFFNYIQSSNNLSEKQLWEILNRARNFFKHPSDSLEDAITLNDADNKSILFIACYDCAMILEKEQPIEMQIFNTWYLATEMPPDIESDKTIEATNILNLLDLTRPGLRAASTPEQKLWGIEWLHRADAGELDFLAPA